MSNTFRPTYRKLSDDEVQSMAEVKEAAKTLEDLINATVPPGRHCSLAQTKLEEAVMWAVKGITG